jgi:hypothetical protein
LPLRAATLRSAQAETPNRQTADVSFHFADEKSHRTVTRTYLRYRGATFQAVLDENGGAGMGFDLLRLVLILWSHCSWNVGTSGVLTSILNSIFHLSPKNVSRLAQPTTTIDNDPTVHQLTGLGRPITLVASTIGLRIASRPISHSMATLLMIRRSLLMLFAQL